MKTMNLSRFRDLVCHMYEHKETGKPFEIKAKKGKIVKLSYTQQRDMFRKLVNQYIYSCLLYTSPSPRDS